MSGFTKSYRSKWTHPVFRSLIEAAIWSWMCDTAAWKKTSVRHNDAIVSLERGQLVTSIRFISKGFGIGDQVTRTFLGNLEKEGMINTRTNTGGTLITICNYCKYQGQGNEDNTPANKRPTHAQHTGNTNKKEDNEVNEYNEGNKPPISPTGSEEGFADFWGSWNPFDMPKGNKSQAMKFYRSALKVIKPSELAKAAKAYCDDCKRRKSKTQHVSTWLNQRGWESVLDSGTSNPKADPDGYGWGFM